VLEEAALHHIDAWTPHIEHKADAAPTLRALRQRGLRTGLLSNTHWPRRVHRHFLERDGLADLLDAEVYSSELAVVKPHPDAFRAALDAVGIDDPSRAVFVGDRPHDDVFGASQVGMRTVFLPTSDVPHFEGAEPDAVIHELSELVTVIDGWLAA
jgi:putative hydrolase of the HAD superfamily